MGILLAFGRPLLELATFIGGYEHYSHIALIPVVAGYLLYAERGEILSGARSHLPLGIALFPFAGGIALTTLSLVLLLLRKAERQFGFARETGLAPSATADLRPIVDAEPRSSKTGSRE